MLKEIGNALVQADVNVRLVLNLRNNIKTAVNLEEMAAGANRRHLIQKVCSPHGRVRRKLQDLP